MRASRIGVLAVLLSAGCGRPAPPAIRLVVPPGRPAGAFIEVAGLSRADLGALHRAGLSAEAWSQLLRVTVKGTAPAGATPQSVAGIYGVVGDALRFTPRYPFDPGRQYEVVFDPGAEPDAGLGARERIVALVERPGEARAAPTRVTAVYPSADVVPENLLRMYVHFSAPMAAANGIEHLSLEDERGNTVAAPFLPLDGNFWNADQTRYTVFFDPGRVKRELEEHREMGRPLRAGHRYALVVHREWADATGQPLAESFRREFRVGDADLRPLEPARWPMSRPVAGTREPLVLDFPKLLDRALALRAIGVARGSAPVAGESAVADGERRWTFTPRDAWQPGDYSLVVLTILEDVAGNRVGHSFEVEGLTKDSAGQPDEVRVPFAIR